MAARAEYYAPDAALHCTIWSRSLFEPGAARVGLGSAVRLLEGGAERAELELVAHEVTALLEAGMKEEEIAIVHRTPSAVAELLGEVFTASAIPYALERRVGFANTVIGGALVGPLRCVTDAGELGDLLAWLRAPGLLERPESADRLEARARREGSSAERARMIRSPNTGAWRRSITCARRRGGVGSRCASAPARARMRCSTRRGAGAPRSGGDELDDARALTVGRRVLSELAGSLGRPPSWG